MTAAMIERRRAVRVRVSPHRVRMGRHDGHLVEVSETGALVHAARPQAPNHQVAMEFELESETVMLTARVVRCWDCHSGTENFPIGPRLSAWPLRNIVELRAGRGGADRAT